MSSAVMDDAKTVTMESKHSPDFTITVNTTPKVTHIKCHKRHLVVHSEYFDTLISDTNTDTITLPGTFNKKIDSLIKYIQCLYVCPHILLQLYDVYDTAEHAAYFVDEYMMSICDSYIISDVNRKLHINGGGLCSAYRYAVQYKRNRVSEAILNNYFFTPK